MSKELKMPGNVITSLRVNHRPGQEKLTTGLSGPSFFKKVRKIWLITHADGLMSNNYQGDQEKNEMF